MGPLRLVAKLALNVSLMPFSSAQRNGLLCETDMSEEELDKKVLTYCTYCVFHSPGTLVPPSSHFCLRDGSCHSQCAD